MDKEYIDRDAAIETFKANCVGCESYGGVLCSACPLNNALLQLDMIPAADVAPVVHGEWLLRHEVVGHYWECSVCHKNPCIYVTKDTKYCQNCGAKMDGGTP
jgi:hypothetical protein